MSTDQALLTIVRVVGPYVGETMARSAAAAHCQKLGITGEVGSEQLEALIARLGSGLNIFLGRDKSARVVAELRQALQAHLALDPLVDSMYVLSYGFLAGGALQQRAVLED